MSQFLPKNWFFFMYMDFLFLKNPNNFKFARVII